MRCLQLKNSLLTRVKLFSSYNNGCNQLIIMKRRDSSICIFEIMFITNLIYQAHRELAREAVRRSLVLLKNGKDPKKPLLPLDKKAKRILVAGTHADNLGYQCGGWTITWEGTTGRITEGKIFQCHCS